MNGGPGFMHSVLHDLEPFFLSFAVSAIFCYPIFRLLLALKSRQTVSQYAPEGHQKKQGTPTMGGLIVAVGFLSVPGYLAIVHASHGFPVTDATIFVLFLGFCLIGFVDDYVVPRMIAGKRGLGWKQKILMQLAIAGFAAWSMYGSFCLEMGGMVFLILFFSNAYNFSDGLDALAGLLLIGLALGLLLISMFADRWGLSRYLLALLGSILPFLYLNRPKAKVFMGDAGSLPIGAVLGMVVAVIAFPRVGPGLSFYGLNPLDASNRSGIPGLHRISPWMIRDLSLFVVSGMMIVELVPVPLQILSVKLRHKKLFSFTPIHHAYERKGWPELKVVLVFVACQFAMSAVAVGIAYYGSKDAVPGQPVSRSAPASHPLSDNQGFLLTSHLNQPTQATLRPQ